jgi:type VI secretion system Hcp family effector
MKKQMIAGLLAAAVLILGAQSAAAQVATETFMFAPGIPGDALRVGRTNWIDVYSLSQSFEGGKQNEGACTVALVKALDRSGPLLWAATVTGQIFSEIRIESVKASGEKAQPFYTLTLTDVLISGIQSTPNLLTENLTLSGAKATLTFFRQNEITGANEEASSATIKCK